MLIIALDTCNFCNSSEVVTPDEEQFNGQSLDWDVKYHLDKPYCISSEVASEITAMAFTFFLYAEIEPILVKRLDLVCYGCLEEQANQLAHECLTPWDYSSFDIASQNHLSDCLKDIDWEEFASNYSSRVNLHNNLIPTQKISSGYWRSRWRINKLAAALSQVHELMEKQFFSACSFNVLLKIMYDRVSCEKFDLNADIPSFSYLHNV